MMRVLLMLFLVRIKSLNQVDFVCPRFQFMSLYIASSKQALPSFQWQEFMDEQDFQKDNLGYLKAYDLYAECSPALLMQVVEPVMEENSGEKKLYIMVNVQRKKKNLQAVILC